MYRQRALPITVVMFLLLHGLPRRCIVAGSNLGSRPSKPSTFHISVSYLTRNCAVPLTARRALREQRSTMRGKYSGYDAWQGGHTSFAEGLLPKRGAARLPVIDTGYWDTCCGRFRKPKTDIVMLVVLFAMGFAGVYISAMVTTMYRHVAVASSHDSKQAGISMFGRKRSSSKTSQVCTMVMFTLQFMCCQTACVEATWHAESL